jgi:hypothetical protein
MECRRHFEHKSHRGDLSAFRFRNESARNLGSSGQMNRSRQTRPKSNNAENFRRIDAFRKLTHRGRSGGQRHHWHSGAACRSPPPLLWRVELFSSESLGWIHFKSSSQLISIRSHQVPCSFAYYVAEGKFDGIKRANWIFSWNCHKMKFKMQMNRLWMLKVERVLLRNINILRRKIIT